MNRGSYVHTLALTDIATGWTECAPLLLREQTLLVGVLGELRSLLPFPLLGLDTDNDTVFMNETLRDYCRDAGIELTRCRPYRKNDQAHIFEAFWQAAHPLRRESDGTGLGLAVARQLARLLGGDVIIAKSELGEGSTFIASLPAQFPGGAFTQTERRRSTNAGTPRA